MPVYQGGFRLGIGERLTLWWPDANNNRYNILVEGPGQVGGVPFRNAGTLHLSTPGDTIAARASFALNEVFGSLTAVSTDSPRAIVPVNVIGLSAPTVVNDGSVTVQSSQDGSGLVATFYDDFQPLLLNRGAVRVDVGEFGYGATMSTGGDFYNSGSIIVRAGLQAIGVEMIDNGVHFNSGLISAQATTPGGIGIGWFANAYYVDNTSLLNTGVIEGDYAYLAYSGGSGATVRGVFDLVTNTATGQLRGAVATGFGADAVVNHGLITGPVLLEHGDDLFISTGTQFDAVEGEDGADTLIGGASSDYLFGGEGADIIFGGAGDDIIGGGRGADNLDGGDGFDTLYFLDALRGVTVDLAMGTSTGAGVDRVRNFEGVWGSAYGDQITGSGGDDVLEGLAGEDVIDGGKGADVLSGGTGDDRLTGGLGADTFVFTSGDGRDVIEDFETVDRLSIHGYASAQMIEQIGADVRIVLSASDSILLRNVQVADLTPAHIAFSTMPLSAEPTANLTQPLLTGQDVVLEAGESLTLTNPRIATLGGWATYSAILLYDANDAQVRQPSVWNGGEIRLETTSNGRQVAGIWNASFSDPGDKTFHNQSTGLISVVNHGSALTYGTMWVAENGFNDGRIEVTGGGDVRGVSVTNFTNTGSISVTAGDEAWGIYSTGNGTIWNTGVVEVDSHGQGSGLHFINARTVVNTGTIRVTDDTDALDSMGVSYSLIANGSFTNTGIIEADYAIRYGSVTDGHNPNNWDFQRLYNGGELRGLVSLSANRDALYNTGLITGEIQLGQGDDLFDGRGGTQAAGVRAGDGADTVYGGSGVDFIDGGDGFDTIVGGGGADVLTGGAGNDYFIFAVGDGADVITDFNASEDQMRFIGYSRWQSVEQVGADTLVRLSATDSILLKNVVATTVTSAWFNYQALPTPNGPVGASPNNRPTPVAPPTAPAAGDLVRGGAEGDTLTGGSGVDRLLGEGGDDILVGGGGNDVLMGGDGSDRLTGGLGEDLLYGGAGADIFIIGDNDIDGDASDRIIDFNPAEGDLIYLTGSQQWAIGAGSLMYGLREISFTNVVGWESAIRYGTPPSGLFPGTATGLTFTGTAEAEVRVGTALADLMNGEGGLDVLDGLDGDDVLNGGDGDDVLHGGLGGDTLTGGEGDDTLRGGAGDDVLSGGNGVDAADYGDATSGVRVDLAVTTAQNTLGGGQDTLTSIERLAGSAYNDTLLGTTGANVLYGAGGDDRLEGRGGDDLLDGGAGMDTAVFTGPRSAYTLSWTDDIADGVTITGPDGISRAINVEWLQFSDLIVSAAREIFTFNGGVAGETATGTNFHDILNGGGGDDVLNGLDGDDILHGGDGGDRLNVGAGNNQLFGDAGDDVLTSRPAIATGTNTLPSRPQTQSLLDGGAGNDIIDFSTSGLTVDWVTARGGDGNDVISVRGAFNALVDGGAGDDIIVLEEAGREAKFTGGDGRDTFRLVQTNPDMPATRPGLITDFTAGEGGDQIDVWPYFQALFPDVPVGSNLFDMGLLRIVGRGTGWVDIEAKSGPGGYFDLVVSLANVMINDLTLANFTGMSSGELGPYNAAGDDRDDVIRGNSFTNYLEGNGGSDILYGEGGNDFLYGGGSADTLYGGDGDDYLDVGASRDQAGDVIGAGDYAYGGAGNDRMLGGQGGAHFFGGAGDDTYDGSGTVHEFADEGIDTIFANVSRNLEENVENLVFGQGSTPYLDYVTDVVGLGNASDNRIVGAGGHDVLRGMDGNDRLEGRLGNDLLVGGAGNDALTGGAGNNSLEGGDGIDIAVFEGARSTFTISTVDGVTTVTSSAGTDTLTGVEGLRFTDGLFDITGNNRLVITVNGSASADRLSGTIEADRINGGGGDDVLTPGMGNDWIDGGSGNDTVLIAGNRADYRLFIQGDGFILKGADGSDRLSNVELIQFSDGKVIDLRIQYGPNGWGAFVDGRDFGDDPQVRPTAPSTGSKADQPQVQPADDDFLLPDDPQILPGLTDKDSDGGPQVLPGIPGKGVDDGALVLPGVDETGKRFTLTADDAGLVVMGRHGPVLLDVDLLHSAPPHDPWA
ncbi:hypothetical protein [Brevundimonas sp. FT23042]|uniref:hypothetical protein n=1 Tax=Brevundimonas sp. FT23042 TaxID=3393749 RepID=UPI003B58AF79